MLLKNAPSISQHLGHKLRAEGSHEMSSYSKSLVCEKCGSLMWTASVRIRAPLRSTRARNQITRRCPSCNAFTSASGSTRETMANEKSTTSPKPRTVPTLSPESKRDNASASSLTPGPTVNDRGFNHRISLSMSSISKKRTKRPRHKGRSSVGSQSNTRPSGLATSFLFKQVED